MPALLCCLTGITCHKHGVCITRATIFKEGKGTLMRTKFDTLEKVIGVLYKKVDSPGHLMIIMCNMRRAMIYSQGCKSGLVKKSETLQ